MYALQSSPIAIGTAVFLVGVLAVIGIVLGALGSAVVRRLSNPVTRYRQLYLCVLLPFALLSWVVFLSLGLGHLVPGGRTGVVGAVLATFTELLAAGIIWLAAYAPTVPGVRNVRDIKLSTGRAVIRMGRYVLGITALVTVAVVPIELGLSSVGLLALVTVFLVTVQAVSPWFIPLIRSVDRPDEPTAETLERLQEGAGLTVRDVRIFDTEQERTANLTVRGVSGYRRLFVTSTFLDMFDDETAAALLAVQAGRQNARVLARVMVGLLITVVPLFVALADIGPLWPLVGVSLGLAIASLWVTRRGVRAADDYAAERVGPETVADALERYADVHGIEPSRRRLANPFSRSPPLGNRIDRLRAQAEAE
ncbi:peptidase [Haloarcula argentinensis]|uniref:M48 family metallopeptidase n=1 Tax=Haloarcula argentinensis TaxID=43776 RepID=A0ABU2F2G5_HALAR|nr:peptidase [Haloarcula argentinensis]MDS0254728.1 M48 family metallopeptidase [Haloarcula argentinensis]